MGSDSETEKTVKEKKKVVALSPIAKPLAGKKLRKRTFKLVRRAAENKCLKRGVKEVVKSIKRGHKGLCVIAGNISPIDVITHVPIMCEEKEIPYSYVSSKEVELIWNLLRFALSRRIWPMQEPPSDQLVGSLCKLSRTREN